MKHMVFSVMIIISLPMLASAQTGALVHEAVAAESLSSEQTAHLVAALAGTVRPGEAAEQTLSTLRDLDYRLPDGEREAVTVGDLALFIAELTDLRGSLRYRAGGGRVAAFRVLQREGLFPSWMPPGHVPTGADVVDVLHRYARLGAEADADVMDSETSAMEPAP
jgi:hypothetical protein